MYNEGGYRRKLLKRIVGEDIINETHLEYEERVK